MKPASETLPSLSVSRAANAADAAVVVMVVVTVVTCAICKHMRHKQLYKIIPKVHVQIDYDVQIITSCMI